MTTLMKKRLLPAVAMVAVLFVSVHAEAALVVDYSPTNPYSFTNNFGTIKFGFTQNFSPAVSAIAHGDLANQNYDNVGDAIESAFHLPTMTFASETTVDVGSNAYKSNLAGSSANIQSDIKYDFLAVHFGGYEAVFHFAGLVLPSQVFNITVYPKPDTTKGGGLSNYRVYNSTPSTVPVPAAAWLFGSALLGLTGVSRRKKTATVVVDA